MLPAFLKTHRWFWHATSSFAASSAAAFTLWKVTSVQNRKQKCMHIPHKSSRTPCSASRAVNTCMISSSLLSSSSFSTCFCTTYHINTTNNRKIKHSQPALQITRCSPKKTPQIILPQPAESHHMLFCKLQPCQHLLALCIQFHLLLCLLDDPRPGCIPSPPLSQPNHFDKSR